LTAVQEGKSEEIIKKDFGNPPYCLVIPGKLHFIEEEALKAMREDVIAINIDTENQILRDFLLAADPAATVLLHSAATGVYVSGCGQVDPASKVLAAVYSQASGYPLYDTFQHYDITGDASNWLALQGIPAISVELSTHESVDWGMNLAGLNALINHMNIQTTVD